MKMLVAPYPRLSALPGTDWELVVGQVSRPIGESIDDWDPSQDLQAKRHVLIEPNEIRGQTGLGARSRVRLLGGWHCDATRTRSFTSTIDISLEEDGGEIDLVAAVVGKDVAIAITLETHLILLFADDDSNPLAARDVGASLWVDGHRVNLEGVASRFPTEWIDFTRGPYPNDAVWYLDWDPARPEYSVLGGMRLYLNIGHPRLKAVLDRGDGESKLLRETIRAEVARQLVTGGLTSTAFLDDVDGHDEETVGAAIRRLVKVLMPGYSAVAARDLLLRDPGRFEARLQAGLRYLHEEEDR